LLVGERGQVRGAELAGNPQRRRGAGFQMNIRSALLDGGLQQALEEVYASGPRSDAEADNGVAMRRGVGLVTGNLAEIGHGALVEFQEKQCDVVAGVAGRGFALNDNAGTADHTLFHAFAGHFDLHFHFGPRRETTLAVKRHAAR